MKVGLIGHRGAGKTTIFNMLTGLQAHVGGFGGKEEVHLGVIKVPDARIDKLSELFEPKKTTYAEIRFTDFPPSETEEDLTSNNAIVTQMREVDAIALILRDFDSDANPIKELNNLLAEMILTDLAVVENRRNRLKKEKARPQEESLLERCTNALENEESLRNLNFSADEENLAAGFGFLSRKPLLVIFNQSDENAGRPIDAAYQEDLERRGLEGLALAGKVEIEIAHATPRRQRLCRQGRRHHRFSICGLIDLGTFLDENSFKLEFERNRKIDYYPPLPMLQKEIGMRKELHCLAGLRLSPLRRIA